MYFFLLNKQHHFISASLDFCRIFSIECQKNKFYDYYMSLQVRFTEIITQFSKIIWKMLHVFFGSNCADSTIKFSWWCIISYTVHPMPDFYMDCRKPTFSMGGWLIAIFRTHLTATTHNVYSHLLSIPSKNVDCSFDAFWY